MTVTIEVSGPLRCRFSPRRGRAVGMGGSRARRRGRARRGRLGSPRRPRRAVRLGAAVSWALYILASARVGREFPRLDGLALAMAVGAVIALPFGIAQAGSALLRLDILAIGPRSRCCRRPSRTLSNSWRSGACGLGVRDPHEPRARHRFSRRFLLLGQHLSWLELAGIALVITASIGAVLAAARAARGAASGTGRRRTPERARRLSRTTRSSRRGPGDGGGGSSTPPGDSGAGMSCVTCFSAVGAIRCLSVPFRSVPFLSYARDCGIRGRCAEVSA